MKHIYSNEIRKRVTDNETYYVLGEQVRKELIAIIESVQQKVDLNYLPEGWNRFDRDAVESMQTWLREGRDFNNKQLVKFFRMLKKFGLPQNITLLAKELSWEFGKNLSQQEMFEIMQERRDQIAQEKMEAEGLVKAKELAYETMYNTLFESN